MPFHERVSAWRMKVYDKTVKHLIIRCPILDMPMDPSLVAFVDDLFEIVTGKDHTELKTYNGQVEQRTGHELEHWWILPEQGTD